MLSNLVISVTRHIFSSAIRSKEINVNRNASYSIVILSRRVILDDKQLIYKTTNMREKTSVCTIDLLLLSIVEN